MQQNPITKVVIAGGGSAGWMTAAALSKFLDLTRCQVTLVESDHIATVGVGEATLPHLRHFNQTLGIDENEFMRATNATYKMGIEFSNWGQKGEGYIHPFGDYGHAIDGIAFHQFWNYLKKKGYPHSISDFSLPVIAAYQNKFDYPNKNKDSILSTYSYAFHLDSALYAKYLRSFAEKQGVTRVEGKITKVEQLDSGDISSLVLDSGIRLDADLFIDCTGMRALLIEETLKTGYKNWNHWLPCDRAVAVPSSQHDSPSPYTKAIAKDSGWQWRIPLQHRTGNGLVYSSEFMDEQSAVDELLGNLVGEPVAEPFTIKFNVGHRNKTWNRNCIAIGLSAGFLEPLESTGLHLIQTAITQLIELFPTKNSEPHVRDEFNRIMEMKFNSVRDFLILHYHGTQRADTDFWNYCRTMSIPDELQLKMDLFKSRGYISQQEGGLFLEPSWVAVYLGQGIYPSGCDPRVYDYPSEIIKDHFDKNRMLIQQAVNTMPSHQESLRNNCKSDAQKLWPEASLNLYGRNN